MFFPPTLSFEQDTSLSMRLEQVDKFLSSKYNSNKPGCVLGIIKDGNLIYNKGFGMANLNGIPMNASSTMNIMSVSKQFTAACIALLIIDKKISLADDVHTYIPELPNYGHKITIENLIRHTSGIRDYNDLVTLAGRSAENRAMRSDGLAIVLRQKQLNFIPGSQYAYSNSGYLLLSYIIERITRMSFEKFTRKRIFEPLEMKQSFFTDKPGKVINNGVISYGKDQSGNYFPYQLNDERMGCAGLYTTVGDLFKWDQNFYTGRLGGQKFNELMLSLGKLNDGKESDYAFGNIIDKHEGFQEVLHSGGLLGIRCKLSRFPSEKLSIIYLGNGSQDINAELYPIASLLLLKKPLPITTTDVSFPITLSDKTVLSENEMEAYAGLYNFPEANLSGQLTINDNGYMEWGTTSRIDKSRLYIESKNEFKATNGQTIRFTLSNPDSIILITKSGRAIQGFRIKAVPADMLSVYTGRYYSKEAQTSVEIKKHKNNLVLEIAGTIVSQPLPLTKNQIQFSHPLLGFIKISFTNQGEQANQSLLLSTERTNHLRFEKVL